VMAIQSKLRVGSKSVDQVVSYVLERIKVIHDQGGEVDEFPTGFYDLDRMTGGLHKSEVSIVAGYPGSGKTSLAMNIAEHAVLTQDRSTVIFSLEMSAESLVSRFLSSHAKVNFRNIRKGYLTPEDFVSLDRTAAALSSSRLFIEDDCDSSVYQIRAKARRLHQKHALHLIIIDYIQLLSASGATKDISSRQEEVAEISRTIKSMAREFSVPVIALSQLNDDGKLRESRAIGQDADNIWLLELQSETSDNATPVKFSINKARNGPVGSFKLIFLKQFTRFESAARVET
jgi:replicative DNA helicase